MYDWLAVEYWRCLLWKPHKLQKVNMKLMTIQIIEIRLSDKYDKVQWVDD